MFSNVSWKKIYQKWQEIQCRDVSVNCQMRCWIFAGNNFKAGSLHWTSWWRKNFHNGFSNVLSPRCDLIYITKPYIAINRLNFSLNRPDSGGTWLFCRSIYNVPLPDGMSTALFDKLWWTLNTSRKDLNSSPQWRISSFLMIAQLCSGNTRNIAICLVFLINHAIVWLRFFWYRLLRLWAIVRCLCSH